MARGVASALVGDGQWPGAQCTALALPLHFRCSVQTGQCQLRPVPLPHCYNPLKGTEPAFGGIRSRAIQSSPPSVQKPLVLLRPPVCVCVCVCARAGACEIEKQRTGMSGGRKGEDEESKGLLRDYFSLLSRVISEALKLQ